MGPFEARIESITREAHDVYVARLSFSGMGHQATYEMRVDTAEGSMTPGEELAPCMEVYDVSSLDILASEDEQRSWHVGRMADRIAAALLQGGLLTAWRSDEDEPAD
jgi:hypothetical protein